MVLILVMIIRSVVVNRGLVALLGTNLLVAAVHILELDTVPLAIDQFVIEVELSGMELGRADSSSASVTGLLVDRHSL